MIQVTRLAALGLVLTLGACKDEGGKASSSPGAAAPAPTSTLRTSVMGRDPCTLISPAEIEKAIGTPVTKTTPYGGIECRWTVTSPANLPKDTDPWVAISIHNDMAMTEVEKAPGTNGVSAISGLGDRAFRTTAFHHLWVKHGSDVFVTKSRLVGFNDKNDATVAASDEIEMRLARLVLTKL